MSSISIGEEKDFEIGKGYTFNLYGEDILVYRGQKSFFAIQNECSHAKFPLEDGILNEEKCSITCIHHGAKFDLESGKVLSLPALKGIKIYKIYIVNNEVYVDVI
jgi:nitrite reductase/ring-hydroxylating ferredoxin subunit